MQYSENQYGHSIYGQVVEVPTPEDLTPDLMRYLPWYYQESRVVKALMGTLAQELAGLWYAMDQVQRQFFVETATWGLDLWEQELGIQKDSLKNHLNRREVVTARLRGYGTTTVDMLKSVAQAYSGGEVEVIEYSGESRFVVKFVGTRGIPPNMQDLTKTIEQIKPAHLAFSFAYSYLVWREASRMTWGDAGTKTWQELRDSPPE